MQLSSSSFYSCFHSPLSTLLLVPMEIARFSLSVIKLWSVQDFSSFFWVWTEFQDFTGTWFMCCRYRLWSWSLLWELPCFRQESTHLHQRPSDHPHYYCKILHLQSDWAPPPPPQSINLIVVGIETEIFDGQIGDLPFNKYTWLVTHNSFSIVDTPALPGVQRLTFYNQEDMVTNQLRVPDSFHSLLWSMFIDPLFGMWESCAKSVWFCHVHLIVAGTYDEQRIFKLTSHFYISKFRYSHWYLPFWINSYVCCCLMGID